MVAEIRPHPVAAVNVGVNGYVSDSHQPNVTNIVQVIILSKIWHSVTQAVNHNKFTKIILGKKRVFEGSLGKFVQQ